jgi:hypothetical protein
MCQRTRNRSSNLLKAGYRSITNNFGFPPLILNIHSLTLACLICKCWVVDKCRRLGWTITHSFTISVSGHHPSRPTLGVLHFIGTWPTSGWEYSWSGEEGSIRLESGATLKGYKSSGWIRINSRHFHLSISICVCFCRLHRRWKFLFFSVLIWYSFQHFCWGF